MMRFCVILIGLAASAAYSHETPDFDLPIPEVKRVFYAADLQTAAHWADKELFGSLIDGSYEWSDSQTPSDDGGFLWSWYVVELAESHFKQLSENLASIQEEQEDAGEHNHCENRDKRFSLYLLLDSTGGIGYERLTYFVYSEGGDSYDNRLTTRFVVAYGGNAKDTALRDTGMSIRFQFVFVDNQHCGGAHSSHSNGNTRHEWQTHDSQPIYGPYTEWLPIADLLDGNVATSTPAEPEEPEEPAEPAEPEEPTDNAEVERLQAELDALRGDLSELNGDLSAVRDSVAFLLGEPPAGGVDTVEVVRHDTLLFCPQTDEERRDLFDLFTGLDDDESETDGPAGKAASVKPSSWGAIKALTRRER